MIDTNTTNEISSHLRRLGDLCGDVELSLYKLIRKYGHGTPLQAGPYTIDVHPTDNGVNGVFIDGVHVLAGDVSKAIDAEDVLAKLINEL